MLKASSGKSPIKATESIKLSQISPPKNENSQKEETLVQENSKLKGEITELKKIVNDQNVKLNKFKKEVIEKFCAPRMQI